jgi:hypothetical protein
MEIINHLIFQDKPLETIEQAVTLGEVYNVSTPQGNAIIIGEQEFRDILATLEMDSNLYLREKLLSGLNTPKEELVDEADVMW